jgi:carboxyl-terminal processing protease
MRLRLGVLLSLSLLACSAKGPSGESPRRFSDAFDAPVATAEASPTSGAADPREVKLSAAIRELLEQGHLLQLPADDQLSRAAFKVYLERLDPGKMFLLKGDADALARHADRIDDELRAGSLDLAHDGSTLFIARVDKVDAMVADLLSKPLDLTDEEYVELDPKKLEFATTEQELRERWRQRLELEVLERVASMEGRLKPKDAATVGTEAEDDKNDDTPAVPKSQIPTTPEGREAKARTDLAKAYSGRFARLRTPATLDAASDVINAVAAAYDPHTSYLPPADKANFDIQMTGSLEGIGAVLRERDHYTEVVELVPGGASWRHGRLEPGDLILSVGGDRGEPIDVVDMRIDEVVKMIRGPKGTVVRLRVQKPTGDEETIAITRDVVVIEEAYARGALLTPPRAKHPYGYIYLPSFYGGQGDGQRTAAGDVRRLLHDMKARKVAGVVIDIRGNGGGYLGDAVEMTGLLVDKGPVVQIQDSAGRREVLDDDEKGTEFDGPVVVLVDRFSASASEIVAAALQDYGRAVIVGTGPTHGKGTVQSLIDLDRAVGNRGGAGELGVFKVTIQQFFRINGASTQREGVTPDIVLPDPAGHLETGERKLDHAIPFKKIDAAPHDRWAATWKTPDLAARSHARVAKDPTFAKITARSKLLKQRLDDTKVPLERDVWEARRTEQKAALAAIEPNLDKGPTRFTVKLIDEPSPAAARPGGKADDRLEKWSKNLAHDPWVDESLRILGDMSAGK